MLKRKTAHVLTALLIGYVIVASVAVLLSPIDFAAVEAAPAHRPRLRLALGPSLQPRGQSLRGDLPDRRRRAVGAALQHRSAEPPPDVGERLIAVGAILPGIGGTATRMGHTEVLYVTELIGLRAHLDGLSHQRAAGRAGADAAGSGEMSLSAGPGR